MPLNWPDYELLDFGEGRKLERFGTQIADRPAPQAEAARPANPLAWRRATAKYTGTKVGTGEWRFTAKGAPPKPIAIACPVTADRTFQLSIAPSPTGQVGLFPEQFANWEWIAAQVAKSKQPMHVLNLFGSTGGSTLAAAAAGAQITHVDASKPAVAMARANAELSGMGEAPIRWIVEDVLKYCRREVKRGSQYHGIVLDPPTYGHGPGGEEWRLTRDLLPLIELCRELTSADRHFVLATCHTPGVGPAELSAYLSEGLFGSCAQPPNSGQLSLVTRKGRRLESGVFARWPR